MKRAPKRGDAYRTVKMIYDYSPGRSWQRLNGALFQTLNAAITAHLSFEPGDFAALRADMNGHYWMGNSVGSVCGESFYIHAVGTRHTPACISFEQYAERPAAIWAEDVKTPERLCIGSRFTWNGIKVTVTNMRTDHLIACSYKDWIDEDLAEGSITYFHDGYRKIDKLRRLGVGGELGIKFSGIVPQPDRKPHRVFKITYEQLAARRKEHDAFRKKLLKEIADADSVGVLEKIAQVSKEQCRPFDIVDFHEAFRERMKALRAAVDHIDGNPRNNDISNLRVVTLAEDKR